MNHAKPVSPSKPPYGQPLAAFVAVGAALHQARHEAEAHATPKLAVVQNENESLRRQAGASGTAEDQEPDKADKAEKGGACTTSPDSR